MIWTVILGIEKFVKEYWTSVQYKGTNIVNTCEPFFDMDVMQEIVNEVNHYVQQLRNYKSNIFSKRCKAHK
jgi:hypothetical protein